MGRRASRSYTVVTGSVHLVGSVRLVGFVHLLRSVHLVGSMPLVGSVHLARVARHPGLSCGALMYLYKHGCSRLGCFFSSLHFSLLYYYYVYCHDLIASS